MIQEYLGAAQAHPEIAGPILQAAAQTFTGLARGQHLPQVGRQLQALALEFQKAAAQHEATRDDFEELLSETAQGLDEADSDLDVVAIREQIHAASTGAAHVSIAPDTFRNESTGLGRAATIRYNPTPEDVASGIQASASLVYWQGEKDEAAAFTVDLGLVSLPRLTPALASFVSSARPFAEIEYGADGNRTLVQCDLGFGVRLTGVGNYVSVRASLDPPIPGGINEAISVGASMGMFAAPSVAPIFRSAYLDLLGSGSRSDPIPRPAKATHLLPVLSTALVGAIEIRFLGASGTNNILYRAVYNLGVPPVGTPIPLTGDVFFLDVTNNTGEVANFRLPFQLSM